MQQTPPPFKRFARARFDGVSVNAQRPGIRPDKIRESSTRIPLGDSHHVQRQMYAQSRPAAEQNATVCLTPASYESTVPQISSDRGRPQELSPASPTVSPVETDAPFPWRLRTGADERQHRLPPPTVRLRRHHAGPGRDARQHEFEVRAPAVHVSLLYPQLSPYSDMGDDVQRSVSQPNTPSFHPHTQQQDMGVSRANTVVSRTSLCSPARRRRTRSATRTGDASFTDEEFHLFVEATAGLGPEQSYRSPLPPCDAVGINGPHIVAEYSQQSGRAQMISPSEETSTTTWAQMPYGTYIPQQRELATWSPPTQRPEMSSALEQWLQLPSVPLEEDYNVSPVEDDELPTYASSQAQAQAAQRVEAARRARELQRRWREHNP